MTFLKRILLVDSEPRSAAAVRAALERTGKYLIKEEHDARCAMNAARWFRPNLILFDVMASAAEANSTAQLFQQDTSLKETPVVFFDYKGGGENRVISSGILSGYRFYANPVDVEEFVCCVSELLNA